MANGSGLHVVVGTGPLGHAVASELTARGKAVRAVNRSGRAEMPTGVEVAGGDVSDHDDARRVCAGASVVYSCANAPYSDWPRAFPPIMAGIIEGAAAANAKVVFGDNLYAYGPVAGPLTEDLAQAAETRKGRVRIEMTEMLLDAHKAGRVRATIGRASDYFGPRVLQSAMGDRVVPAALAGKAAQLVGDIDQPHTYTYVPDFGRALVTLGERDEALGEIWHAPNAETVTTRRFVEMIYEAAGNEPKVQVAPKLLLAVMGLINADVRELREMLYEFEAPFIVDHTKFERAFGADPTPLPEAIRATVDWYRQRTP